MTDILSRPLVAARRAAGYTRAWISVLQFLAMGGYAAYVWPAYGIAALILIGLVVASRRKLRAAQRDVALLEAAGKRRGGDDA